MTKWEEFLKRSTREEEEIEYPLYIRLLIFLLLLGVFGGLFYLFVFDRSPQYYIMKGVSNFVT
jgi:hypothetical protein